MNGVILVVELYSELCEYSTQESKEDQEVGLWAVMQRRAVASSWLNHFVGPFNCG